MPKTGRWKLSKDGNYKGGDMILSFELSMPNNNAWNGKWTGEGTLYAIVKNFGRGKKANVKAQQLLDK